MGEMARTRIRIVENDCEFTLLPTEFLKAKSCHMLPVRDGVTAIQAVREHPPQLVLPDILIPRTDGLNLPPHSRVFRLTIMIVSGKADESASPRLGPGGRR